MEPLARSEGPCLLSMLVVGVVGQQKGVLPCKRGGGLALVVLAALEPLARSALDPDAVGYSRCVGSPWVTKQRQRSAPLKLNVSEPLNHEQEESADLRAWLNLNLTEGSTVLLMTAVGFQQANTVTLTCGCCP